MGGRLSMTIQRKPFFNVGEVCILQPPHPSARHLWGVETTVLKIIWNADRFEDAMGVREPGYCYLTDVDVPPPTDLPEDQHDGWVWCEYDLKKKHDPGQAFESILQDIEDLTVKIRR